MIHPACAVPATACLFSAQDERYRRPFGAVSAETAIHFRLCLPRHLGCHHACMEWQPDGEPSLDWGLFWCGMEGSDYEWWECDFTPARPGLYFYRFRLQTALGQRFLVKAPDSTAYLSETGGAWWQTTVYDADFVTPDWLAGGVFYQIFPDRFAGDAGEKTGVPADRVLRRDWGGEPAWRPDAQGVVRNNDYFGGSLRGILEKLPYLQSLGVTCLYLNPIFEAHSNHRYDTADYRKIDPLLGDEADFTALCTAARARGMRVILDGVFSHTGADSRYFNKNGRYDEKGAYQSPDSPYASWYTFRQFPNDYAAWWGFSTLPEVREEDPSFDRYINGPQGVVRHWLAAGASGWRLDVADELPDGFLESLRAAAKAEKPDALVLGEVWEDASNKQSYGRRRRYLLGRQLDSVMNYPFANAIYAFLRGETADAFFDPVCTVLEHYPPQVTAVLMNPLGTHDTARALTVLAGEAAGRRGREWQAAQRLSAGERERGIRLLQLASLLQYMLPGVPCLYYGDEAGMEGYGDPFNRGCFPWGQEASALTDWYRRLGELRRDMRSVCRAPLYRVAAPSDTVVFTRELAENEDTPAFLCAVNRGEEAVTPAIPPRFAQAATVLGEGTVADGRLTLPPLGCAVLKA